MVRPPGDHEDPAEESPILLPEGECPPTSGEPLNKLPLVFVPLMACTCVAMLACELYVNGRDAPPGPATEECHFRYAVQGTLFCAASMSTNPLFGPTNEVLLRLGAKSSHRILHWGEAWRLVTPLFLHGGLVHLALNMAVFLQLGSRLEENHGAVRVGAVYLSSGVFGVIMSAVLAPHSTSVGASGAICGLMGASVGEVIQNWHTFATPWLALAELICNATVQILVGTMPMVDNFQHFFGCVMGFVTGTSVLVLPDTRAPRRGWPLALRCRRQLLQGVAGSVAYLLFIAGLLALYGEWDANSLCPFCRKIECLPFPWGCRTNVVGECWWDCSTCTGGGLSGQATWVGSPANGSVVMRCPLLRNTDDGGFANKTVYPVDVSDWGRRELVQLCKGHCPDGNL